MNLGSICKRHVVTIDRQATLQEAARRMRDQHVGALVVTHDGPEGRRVEGHAGPAVGETRGVRADGP